MAREQLHMTIDVALTHVHRRWVVRDAIICLLRNASKIRIRNANETHYK